MIRLCLALLIVLSPSAFAEAPDTIIIPHDTHFEAGVECADCHDGAAVVANPSLNLYPTMEACEGCHDIEDDENCDMCHSNVDNAGDYLRHQYTVLFSHGPHLAKEASCTACHGDPAMAQPSFPGKPDCRKCHTTVDDYQDCRMCHASGFELRPVDHGPAWINTHGADARFDQQSCSQCHTENTCQECHAGDNVRPRSHTLNYAYNHALDARGKTIDCITCHADPDFCSSCHAANRIMPSDHSSAGWLGMTDGGRHATEGLFDLESCIACHSAGAEDPTCAQCHRR